MPVVENAGENRQSKCQIYGRISSRCESRLWEVYSFFKRELSAWIIIRAKSLCQYQSGSNTVNPKDVNFMQSSIKNQTGEHTVLGNAEALKSGALKATDLPEIRIWQDADGKLWTLDHRRLAAFRMAKLDSVPFRWATDEEVANQMWKMTTKTNGISIKLKLADGQSMTIQQGGA